MTAAKSRIEARCKGLTGSKLKAGRVYLISNPPRAGIVTVYTRTNKYICQAVATLFEIIH